MKQSKHKLTSGRSRLAAGALALLALSSPAMTQIGLQVFLGQSGQPGAVTSFNESTGQLLGSPVSLQGIQLLPLDFNGRRTTDELDSSRARHHADIPGAARIRLPGQLGVLYRFERAEAGGGRTFGYLRIDPQGVPQLLAQRPGTGALADQDPYSDRIALAPDASAMLTSTRVGAGGNLLEVDLTSGLVIDRTSNAPPLDFREQSLCLANDWLAAVCSRAVVRSGRAPQNRITRVHGITSGPLFTGELAMSPNGTHAMTTVGSNLAALDVFVFSASGTADKLTTTPARIQGAGFQPEATHGPFFAVSDDGQWCAWTSEIAAKRELFMRQNSPAAIAPETQITRDTNFTDTLDEIGVLGIFQPGRLLIAVGEISLDVGVGIENLDFFEVQLNAAGVESLTNLTQTSGQSVAPFLAQPQISPTHIRWLPAAGAFLMYDDQGGGSGRLLAVRPGVLGLEVVMGNLKDVDFIEAVGSSIVVSLRISNQSQQHQLIELPADLSSSPVVLYDGADDALLQPLVAQDRWIVFTEVPDLGAQRLSRVDLLTGTYETFALSADSFGPALGLTTGGELAFGFRLNGAPRLAVWPFGGAPPFLLAAPNGDGGVLPGR